MDLNEIKHPNELKDLSIEELKTLSEHIRSFLIEQLSVTGGHLGPNLGVVELTLALHQTFDSPKDKLIWDVGHQSYVHKILTGRTNAFSTLRKYKGLCGFPKRNESDHDIWETGHSSTSLSAAMGMAIARDIKKEDHSVVPIIGDGALTGGMALEALNHIGSEKKNVIVILNDNEMSIAPNVGALHNILGRLRSGNKYNWVKDEIEWVMKKIPAVGGRIATVAERVKDSMKYLVVPGMFFEELGFTYYGPVDGHDFEDLFKSINYAKKTEGPILIHAITKKGKGYKPAETDKVGTWHGVGPYKIESGEGLKKASNGPGWSKIVSDTLTKVAEKDEKVVAITPAMTVGSKLEDFKKKFPDRLFDVGIAEQHATTLAGGVATQGMKPFLSIYSTFLQRGFDQVVHDVCRQNLNVAFGIDRAGLVGADGETHQGVFDISFLRDLPNMTIMMPKDANECQHMVYTALEHSDGPIAVRYPRGNAKEAPSDESLKKVPIGTWEVIREGNDAVILTFGTMIDKALETADQLEKEDVSVKVVNARFIKPLDEQMLSEIANLNLPVLTLEEHALQGGFGSAVLEFFESHNIPFPFIKRMGIPDRFIEHGSVDELLEEIGLTTEQITQTLKEMVPSKEKRA
ncbi:1-deoxy-D-xylulose-5-phosphate synthase [Tenuibacillus multivorans]|uniref:1-deoxy-D-xylulose-5-phosphate synthase n=1 Tax=Tenuibacillus multivorans TaxID=237069 RepID=A0A1G9Z6F1_9BACI|nr:1-deoxy-D-xylulose-5-phosphate synthase [Tenuibacillus multivorans]GEL77377.1 1-deoxy-D-xylulose-5-phosphate synthase [Tenuibacillus multivorans]SDN17002.1 1-deoxy-D-xylulose-5-phosphate synthase [Tenuibacillus multivorans]